MSNEELALRIQAGERKFVAPLWDQVERLIGMMAGKFYARRQRRCESCGVTVDDLKQSGFLALYDAISAFDREKEIPLIAYLRYPLKNHWNALLGLRTARQCNEPLNNADSLDEPVQEEGEPLAHFIPDPAAEEAFENAINDHWLGQLRQAEEAALCEIGDPEVIRKRYFERLTLAEAGQHFGVSPGRVRQREQKALRQLRLPRAAKYLYPFCAERVESLALRGTGVQAFRHGGSATERAVEVMERESPIRRTIAMREADHQLQEAIRASRAGEQVDLGEAVAVWQASLSASR